MTVVNSCRDISSVARVREMIKIKIKIKEQTKESTRMYRVCLTESKKKKVYVTV